ncbi:MAG: hypothetical protein LUE06_08025 [Oscillospiraceae bacterium]|nr:hypothetical protein [Oscillospiraceae bacterium]
MRAKTFVSALLCAALLAGTAAVNAMALQTGAYTGSVTTSYYNPDTGNVDDGGTSNAALGEGMCRSATAKTGLVEIDGDGNVWVTIRLQLQSSCSNVAFYTRTGYDSYSKVSYTITAEDSGNDSIDYRFAIPSAGTYIKATMYVTPMGRDVLWYLWVDTSTLTSGSGDFVVSIDLSESAAPTETEAPAETAAPAETETPDETPTPAETQMAAETESPAETAQPAAAEQTAEPAAAESPQETTEAVSTDEDDAADVSSDVSAAAPVEADEADEAASSADSADEAENADEESPAVSGAVIAVIVVIAAAAAVGAVCCVKRKR